MDGGRALGSGDRARRRLMRRGGCRCGRGRFLNNRRAGAEDRGNGRDNTNGSQFFHNQVVTC